MRRWRWRAQSHCLLRCLQGSATLHTHTLLPILGHQLHIPTGASLLNRSGEERWFCKSVMSHIEDDIHSTSEQPENIKHNFVQPLKTDEGELQDALYECKKEEILATVGTTSDEHDSLIEAQCRTICEILDSSNRKENLQPFVKCLSTCLVERVLNQMSNVKTLMFFFHWAAKQAGYKHNICVYNALLKKMTMTKHFNTVWDVVKRMKVDRCPPNSTTFAIIIQNYVEAGELDQSWKAFEEARGCGVKLDAHTYTVLMQILFDSGRVEKAKKVFARMRECSLELNTDIWSMVIYGLCKKQKMEAAETWFEQMKASGCMPDADLYNAMIVGFCEWKRPKKAFSLFNLMQKDGCKPLTCTCNTIIQAYCSCNMFAEADSLISTMQEAGCKPNQITYNILLEKLLDQGKPTDAASLFNTMRKADMVDSNSYRIYALFVSRLGGERKLLAFSEKLSSKDGTCDVEVCNAILQYYCNLGELSKASKYLNEDFMRLSAPNDYSYTLMIDAFCKSRDFDAARSLLSSMAERGCKASGRNYEPVIAALCKDSKELEACQLFQEMSEKGIEASSSTCLHLLKSLSDAGLADWATEICDYIAERRHIIEDRLTVLAFFKCLSKSNRLQEANVLVRRMMRQGCLPRKSSSFKCALAYMMRGKFDEVEKYLHKQLPNAISYTAMLRAACTKRKFDKAKSILSEMKVQGCAPDSFCYQALIMGLIKSGVGLMDCVQLYEEMLERGVVPFGRLHSFLMLTFCSAKQEDVIMRLGKLIIAKGLTIKRNTVSCLECAESSELKKLYIELNDSNCLVERYATDDEEEVDLDEENSE